MEEPHTNQNEIQNLSTSLSETLKDADLQSVTTDLAETFSDALLQDGLLKDIPIIGTIVGLTKTAINLKDRLLIKKLVYFISELKDIEQHKRNRLISKIDNSERQKIKVGEKLLYIIDRCEDHITSAYVAKLFKAFLNEKIAYTDFLRGSTILNKIFIYDFEEFINNNDYSVEREITEANPLTDFENSLITAGICYTTIGEIKVKDGRNYNSSFKIGDKYDAEGGNLSIQVSDIGVILGRVFADE